MRSRESAHTRFMMACCLAAFVAAAICGSGAMAAVPLPRAESSIALGGSAADTGGAQERAEAAGISGDGPAAIGKMLMSTALPLAGVLGLAFGAAWVMRTIARQRVFGGGVASSLAAAMGPGGRAPSGVLEVLGRYPVGRGVTYVLLRVDRRVLLIGQTVGKTGPGVTTLAEISGEDDVASIVLKTRDEAGETADRAFREALTAMERGHDAAESRAPSGRAAHARTAGGDRVELLSTDRASDALSRIRTRLESLRGVGGDASGTVAAGGRA